MLITQGCFSQCWAVLTQSRSFLFLTLPHQRVCWACTRSWVIPTERRDIPYHMTLRSSYKASGRRRKGDILGVMEFVFPSNRCVWWSPAFLEMALNTCLPKWSSERFPCFALLVCTAFALPVKLPLSQTCTFSYFYPSASLSHLIESGWMSRCLVLSCLLGLTHDTDSEWLGIQ